jgi:hypothetical protein
LNIQHLAVKQSPPNNETGPMLPPGGPNLAGPVPKQNKPPKMSDNDEFWTLVWIWLSSIPRWGFTGLMHIPFFWLSTFVFWLSPKYENPI